MDEARLIYQPLVIHEIGGRDFVTMDDLYDSYMLNMKANNKRVISKPHFLEELSEECIASEKVKTDKGESICEGLYLNVVVSDYDKFKHRLPSARIIRY